MKNAISFTNPKHKKFVVFGILAIILGLSIIFIFKKRKVQDAAAYAKYIESYTAGTISKNSFIKVHLTSPAKSLTTLGKPEHKELFEFSPKIKGKTYWVDAQTIEFRPDEPLESDQNYEAVLHLDEVMTTEKGLEEFNFDFKVIKPGLTLTQFGLVSQNSTSLTYMKLNGEINTADNEETAKIEKTLSLDYKQKLKIKWQHHPERNSSLFTIDSIQKSEVEQELLLKWDGEAINAADKKGEEKIAVPAKTIFEVLDIRAVQNTEDYILIQCSHPVNVGQDLNGLISVSNIQDLRFTIEGSQIKVYAAEDLLGDYSVTVNAAITNIESKKLGSAKTALVNFEDKAPSVTIAGAGTILPNSGKLVLPFESVNLKAVDVTIIKIYENNIPQFFQVNNYKEGNELRRVARPVVQKTIRLDDDKGLNLHKKTRFTLDLDKLIRTEPGAMYRVTIGFRQSYNLYACEASEAATKSSPSDEDDGGYSEEIDEDDEFWARYDDYYPDNFSWDEKDDPCTSSYYTNDRWASRNLLASNIGLITKRGSDNQMFVAATNLLTAKPMGGVSLAFLDYQRQVITTVKTNSDGWATFDLKRKPFLLIAKDGKERGYLKLDDGNALPLSRFDVAGDVVQQGIKGFIYGERGVWRPGDSVYLSFVLENKLKNLPANYPITFELFNPKGQLSRKQVITKELNGFYTIHTVTETNAPTGNWLAKVKVGGAAFSKTIKVETVMPNRLKIDFNLAGKTYLGNGPASATTLAARWLFGTPAKFLKAKVDVNLNAATTNFKGFENYSFDNPTIKFTSQLKTIFEGTLNEAGTAQVNTNLGENISAPGVLRANFTTKVFEPGGNFSIDNLSVPYHVFSSYIGIKTPAGDRLSGRLLTDQNHQVDIVNVNRDGKLIAGVKTVEVEIYKVQWRWWWEQDGEESYANFTQNEYNKLISRQTVTIKNGKAIWNFRINQPDWGRFLILVKDINNGHVAGKSVYIDWPSWSQREQNSNPTEASMLSFTANKKQFTVGEDITLTIPSGENGRALVSIENGTRVLKTYWIDTKKGQTQFTFKAEAAMAPNVFANITLLQRHAQTVNDLPIRMYGVIPLHIEDPATILKPIIKMADVLKPETESSITIAEQNGKAMTYTVALVDEGLLDLTRFKTPDPHAVFYAREGLGVKTWDLFDQVLGAWGGNLERILSIGGDGTVNKNANPAKANRFKPVVKVMGPFHIAKGESKTHKFKLPQYIGSVRAMVVAGEEGAYGTTEKTVEVKKPLMVLATLPRVIGPGESFVLPVNIFATNNNLRAVTVQLQASNLIVSGAKTQQLNFKEAGEQMAYFNVVAPNMVGIAKVRINVQSGAEKTFYEVEMDIRNPNPYITNVVSATIQPGATWSSKIAAIGINSTNSGAIEVSAIPAINLNKRLGYLIQYPHGCVEQTTSSVFPQLVLPNLTPLTEQKKAQVERNIKTAINRLKGFQTVDGGLSYWPGEASADEWGTNYAGHFLIEAQNLGYSLPAGLLDGLIRFQKAKANNWTPNSSNFYGGDLSQAYRLYTLALAKKPEISAMNRLRGFEYLSESAKWRLAAAYRLAGQASAAANLINKLPLQTKDYNQLGGTYGSGLRDEAMILETLSLMGQKARAAQLLQTVAAHLGSESWYSTQTTAYSLLAIAKFCGQNKAANRLLYNYTIDGQKGTVNSEQFLNSTNLNFKTNVASIANTGKNTLFIRLVLQGQPAAGQNNFLTENQRALVMNVNYKTLKGQALDPSLLKQGTDFYAEVTVKNPGKLGYYEQMALTQIFPSGWEIINTRLNDNESMLASAPYTYRDIKDDRVYTYFNIRENETLTYKILLNASYLGKYYLSAVQCEAMYNNNISATKPGKWVQVVK
jgi:uncharacterized protein YfaS (alpha-2-macroglobulin family)